MLRITPQERQALSVTALLLIAGAGVRLVTTPTGPVEWSPSGADTLVGSGLAEVQAAAEEELERERIRNEPLEPGERIDPNRADALQLDRLPRVGPALAERIVAYRESRGPFRSLADLDSVPGVGPAMLASLAPHLDLPAVPPPTLGSGRRSREDSREGASATVDLNRASPVELEALPGIGPALAARIIASREAEGRFGSVDELLRVPGIGPALLERLRPAVRVTR